MLAGDCAAGSAAAADTGTDDRAPGDRRDGTELVLHPHALPPTAQMENPFAWRGGFVALGRPDEESHVAVWTSPDGATWSSHPLPFPRGKLIEALATPDGLLFVSGFETVTGGHRATHLRFWSSRDAITWTEAHGPTIPWIDGLVMTARPIVLGGRPVILERQFVNTCCGTLPNVVAAAAQGLGAATGDGRPAAARVAAGSATGSGGIWAWTPRGTSDWVRQPVAGVGSDFTVMDATAGRAIGMTHFDGSFVMVESSDGVSWRRVSVLPDAAREVGLQLDRLPHGYIAVSSRDVAPGHTIGHLSVWVAGRDGRWKSVIDEEGASPRSFSTAGDEAVIGTEGGAIVSLDAGITWQPIAETAYRRPDCAVFAALRPRLVLGFDECAPGRQPVTVLSASLPGQPAR